MAIQIKSVTSKAITRCEKDFSCLSGNEECVCWVAYASRYRFVQVKPQSNYPCSYLFHYGNETYCLCPTRNELYNRYQI